MFQLLLLLTEHFNGDGKDILRNDSSIDGDIVDHFVERASFHFFPFQIGQGVGDEVEQGAALLQLLDEQFFCFRRLKRKSNEKKNEVRSNREAACGFEPFKKEAALNAARLMSF